MRIIEEERDIAGVKVKIPRTVVETRDGRPLPAPKWPEPPKAETPPAKLESLPTVDPLQPPAQPVPPQPAPTPPPTGTPFKP
jgi:hypothetical protein